MVDATITTLAELPAVLAVTARPRGTARLMKVGILAAGAGSRLRTGGFHLPKPLLPIAGVPLIGRLLGAVQPLMPEAIVCIINNQGTSVVAYVRQH